MDHVLPLKRYDGVVVKSFLFGDAVVIALACFIGDGIAG